MNKFIPAFPTYFADDSMSTGMTLRDYFAAMTLQSLINTEFYSDLGNQIGWEEIAKNFDLAEECYGVADAMMEARK